MKHFKDYKELQDEVDKVFREYLTDLLRLKGQPLKYFYWSPHFFEHVGYLSFKHYPLSSTQKDEINNLGKLFSSFTDVTFEVNKNSHRNDLTVRNFVKFFSGYTSKLPQTNRYEYIKEFALWEIMKDLVLVNVVSSSIVEQQKKNFLHTYLLFLIDNGAMPNYPEFDEYINYNLTAQGEELLKKIKLLETTKSITNDELLQKINNLYIRKEDEFKLHFVFSREGGEDKEELRELLDVMGKVETGKLYRGQANANWKLDSSLTREPKYLEHEAEMYYEILSLKPDSFVHDHTVYERLITMQHFGMPTRLMDITRNPLVAIFFACNNLERANVDGVVYTFKRENKDFLNFENDKLNNLKILFDKSNGVVVDITKNTFLTKIWFIKGVAKNQRINSQSGDFIFVGTGPTIEEDLKKLPTMSIIIDAKTKKILLEQLESLNIHGGAVYPDLTHMSNYIRNRYLLDKGKTSKINFVNITGKRSKPVKKAVKAPSSKTTPKTIVKLVNDFDETKFWTKTREKKAANFANKHSLDVDKFRVVLNDYYFKGRLEHDTIRDILTVNLKLIEKVNLAKSVVNEVKKFADELKK